jgi:hypothetical protein
MNCKNILLQHISISINFSRRRSSQNNRRTSRRSTLRGQVPVDKLLFLRHRAKENMKFGRCSPEENHY